MSVSQFTHEGTTYNFEPPVETGDRTPEDLVELVAIAQKGPDVTGMELQAARLSVRLVLKHRESDELTALNALLHDQHQVTVE